MFTENNKKRTALLFVVSVESVTTCFNQFYTTSYYKEHTFTNDYCLLLVPSRYFSRFLILCLSVIHLCLVYEAIF